MADTTPSWDDTSDVTTAPSWDDTAPATEPAAAIYKIGGDGKPVPYEGEQPTKKGVIVMGRGEEKKSSPRVDSGTTPKGETSLLEHTQDQIEELINTDPSYQDPQKRKEFYNSASSLDLKQQKELMQHGEDYALYMPKIAELGQKINKNHTDTKSLNDLASIYIQLGKQADARNFYSESLNVNPKDATANTGLGWLELKQKNYKAALPYFETAKANATNYGELQQALLGTANAKHNSGDLKGAEADYDAANKISPSSYALHQKANIQEKKKSPDATATRMAANAQSFLEQNPEQQQAANNYSEAIYQPQADAQVNDKVEQFGLPKMLGKYVADSITETLGEITSGIGEADDGTAHLLKNMFGLGASKNLPQQVKPKEMSNTEASLKILNGATGAAFGALMSTPQGQMFKYATDLLPEKIKEPIFNPADYLLPYQDKQSKEMVAFKGLVNSVASLAYFHYATAGMGDGAQIAKDYLDGKKITEDQYNTMRDAAGHVSGDDLQAVIKTYSDIPKTDAKGNPIPEEKQTQVFPLLVEYNQELKKLEGTNEAFKEIQQKKIDGIKNQINDIINAPPPEAKATEGEKKSESDAIQKPSTESVLPRQQEEVGGKEGERSGVGQSKQGAEAPQAHPKKEAVEGDEVQLPPLIEGGKPVVMKFSDGEWQRKINDRETSAMGKKFRDAAQEEFDKTASPEAASGTEGKETPSENGKSKSEEEGKSKDAEEKDVLTSAAPPPAEEAGVEAAKEKHEADNKEAKGHGDFDSAPHLVNSYNKAKGTDFKTYDELKAAVGEKGLADYGKEREARKASEAKMPKEGGEVQLPPLMKDGKPVIMKFEDGEWKRRINDRETSPMSDKFKEAAQKAFEERKPAEVKAEEKLVIEKVAPEKPKPAEPVKEEPPKKKTEEDTLEEELNKHLGITKDGKEEYTAEDIHKLDENKFKKKDQRKVAGDAKRVVKSISKLVGKGGKKLKVVIHNSPDSFYEAVKEKSPQSARDAKGAKGVYFSSDGSIHLNMSRVSSDTMLHEGFHPILDYLADGNPEIIDHFFNQLAGIKGKLVLPDGKVVENGAARILSDARKNYKGKTTIRKEAITDFVAKVADGSFKVDSSNFEKVKTYILKTLKKMGLEVNKDINNIRSLKDLAKNISDKFKAGEEVGAGDTKVGQIEGQGQFQAEKILSGETRHPVFKSLKEAAQWVQDWAAKPANKIFKRELSALSDHMIVKKLAEHTMKELKAWERVKEGYVGFYDEDVPKKLNPDLAKFIKNKYGREIKNEEISLFHILGSFGSAGTTPKVEGIYATKALDRYLKTGEISPFSDKVKMEYEKVAGVTDSRQNKRTGNPVINEETGKPQEALLSPFYSKAGVDGVNRVVKHFGGNLKKAIDWLESQHPYEEVSKVVGDDKLSTHENMTKENGGFGIFGIAGAKVGSYILNRVGEFSTVTKDMWYAREMARKFGEPLFDKDGNVLNDPWKATGEGLRMRNLADKAYRQVGDELGIPPAIVQQRTWDIEKKIYANLGAKVDNSRLSEGLKAGVEKVRSAEEIKKQTSLFEDEGQFQKSAEDLRDDLKTFTLGYAPFKEGKITDIADGEKAFDEKSFKQWKKMSSTFAKQIGLEITEDNDGIGIYGATSENAEASTVPTVRGTKEQVDLFAALMGTLAPEGQHSVMALEYHPDGDATEHRIEFSDKKAAIDFIKNRTEYGINDVSLLPASNTAVVLDFGGFDANKLLDNYEGKIKGHEYRGVNTRFISEKEYSGILHQAGDTIQGHDSDEYRKNISDAIELAKQRAGRQGSDYDAKLAETRQEARRGVDDYVSKNKESLGIPEPVKTDVRAIDATTARGVKDAYEALPDDHSSHPDVAKSYNAAVKEIDKQYSYLTKDLGIKVEFVTDDPYRSSDDMFSDIAKNKTLKVFKGGEPHSFLGESSLDENGLTANEKLRAVHDYFGHFVNGNQFGKIGEERAWVDHSKMFSPDAQAAVTTETRGQNNWVNWSGRNESVFKLFEQGHNLIKEGNITEGNRLIAEGKAKFEFAKQKVAILPKELTDWKKYETADSGQFSKGDDNDKLREFAQAKLAQGASEEALVNVLKKRGLSEAEARSMLKPDEEQSITGSSIAARAARASELGILPSESGVGWDGEEATMKGYELLEKGADPYKRVEELRKHLDKLVADGSTEAEAMNSMHTSPNDQALIKAQIATLARETNRAGDSGDKAAYEAAKKKEQEFLDASKPFATLASKQLSAYQGAIDVDTGSPTGLERAFTEMHKKEPSPRQKAQAAEKAQRVKSAERLEAKKTDELKEAVNKFVSETPEAKPKVTGVREKKALVEKAHSEIAKGLNNLFSKFAGGQFQFGFPSGSYDFGYSSHKTNFKDKRSASEKAADRERAEREELANRDPEGSLTDKHYELFKQRHAENGIIDLPTKEGRAEIDIVNNIISFGDKQDKRDNTGNHRIEKYDSQEAFDEKAKSIIADWAEGQYSVSGDANKSEILDGMRDVIAKIVEGGGVDLNDAIAFAKDHIAKTFPDIVTEAEIDKVFEADKYIDGRKKLRDKILEGKAAAEKDGRSLTPNQAEELDAVNAEIEAAREKMGTRMSEGEKKISRLNKQIDDLLSGKERNEKGEPIFTDEEKAKIDRLTAQRDELKIKKLRESLQEQFVDKTDGKFTTDEARGLWEYAKKQYIDQGVSFDKTVVKVADDLGLNTDQVRRAMVTPKQVRPFVKEAYRMQSDRMAAQRDARQWVQDADRTVFEKAFSNAVKLRFALSVWGHGTVGMITHAGMNMFRPSGWKDYFRNQALQYRLLSKSQHRQFMNDFTQRDNYDFWKSAGLAVDPHKAYEEYQQSEGVLDKIGKPFKAVSAMGNRGFDALKVYRYDYAQTEWMKLRPEERTPEVAKEIAGQINTITGAPKINLHPAWSTAFFAPKLVVGRFRRVILQPYKALRTLSRWNKSTTAEKVGAKMTARRTGETIATLGSMLAINQAVLSLTGSPQSINFTDPTKKDWLRFKVGGRVVDSTGGVLSAIDFVAKLGALGYEGAKRRPDVELGRMTIQEASGKLSPFMSMVVDAVFRHDYGGNTVPWSDQQPWYKDGEKLKWWQYLAGSQSPIPVAEAYKDVAQSMKEQGVEKTDIKEILIGMSLAGIVGFSGVRIAEPSKGSSHYVEGEGSQTEEAAPTEQGSTEEGVSEDSIPSNR